MAHSTDNAYSTAEDLSTFISSTSSSHSIKPLSSKDYRMNPLLLFSRPRGAEHEFAHLHYSFRRPLYLLAAPGGIQTWILFLLIEALVDDEPWWSYLSLAFVVLSNFGFLFFFLIPKIVRYEWVIEGFLFCYHLLGVIRLAWHDLRWFGMRDPLIGPLHTAGIIIEVGVYVSIRPRFYLCLAISLLGSAFKLIYGGLIEGLTDYYWLFIFHWLVSQAIALSVSYSLTRTDRTMFRMSKELEWKNREMTLVATRTLNLLKNVLPSSFVPKVDLMQNGSYVERITDGIILESDLVGFTAWASQWEESPEEVYNAVDSYFSVFDEFCSRIPLLDKLHTVGDALIVFGVSRSSYMYAMRLAIGLHLCVRRVNHEILKESSQLRLRVGVAGGTFCLVLRGGLSKAVGGLSFDAMGYCYTEAIRLEQSGLPGSVLVNEAVLEETKHRFEFEERESDFEGEGERAMVGFLDVSSQEAIERCVKGNEMELAALNGTADAAMICVSGNEILSPVLEESVDSPSSFSSLGNMNDDDDQKVAVEDVIPVKEARCGKIKKWYDDHKDDLSCIRQEDGFLRYFGFFTDLRKEWQFRQSVHHTSAFLHSFELILPFLGNLILILFLVVVRLPDLFDSINPFVIFLYVLMVYEIVATVLMLVLIQLCQGRCYEKGFSLLFLAIVSVHTILYEIEFVLSVFYVPHPQSIALLFLMNSVSFLILEPLVPPPIKAIIHLFEVVVYYLAFGIHFGDFRLFFHYLAYPMPAIVIFAIGLWSKERAIRAIYSLQLKIQENVLSIQRGEERKKALLRSVLPEMVVAGFGDERGGRSFASSKRSVVCFLMIESDTRLQDQDVQSLSSFVSFLSNVQVEFESALLKSSCVPVKKFDQSLIFTTASDEEADVLHAIEGAKLCYAIFRVGRNAAGDHLRSFRLRLRAGLAVGAYYSGVFGHLRWSWDVIGSCVNFSARLCTRVAGDGELAISDGNLGAERMERLEGEVRFTSKGVFSLKGVSNEVQCSVVQL